MVASKRAGARDRRVQEGQGMGECKRAGAREDRVQEGRRAGEGTMGWESAKGQE